MMKIRVLFGLLALASVSATAATTTQPTSALTTSRVGNLEFLRNVFKAQYAPAEWKHSFANWSLDDVVNQAEQQVSSSADLSAKDYQQIVRKLFLSARDYHTSVTFVSTEQAKLPFTVKGAEGRYFIVYLDRSKLSESEFPIHEGDELIRFGGQSTGEAIQALLSEGIINSQQTDQESAELSLTSRRASRGLRVPNGPIEITVKSQSTDQLVTRQLMWDYTPESIPYELAQALSSTRASDTGSNILSHKWMVAGDADLSAGASLGGNPYAVGARKTFTPDLGTKIWSSADTDPFYAYIFKNADGKLIGYVRIPSYEADMYAKDSIAAVAHFKSVITLFEATTDGLVIDQVNNPGGSFFYMYALASMLTDHTLQTPKHRMKITPADVKSALENLAGFEKVKSDEDAAKILQNDMDGYPATYETVQFLKSFAHFIVSEYGAGRTFTQPYWLEGADKINPAPDHYTKPILVLINALDFSCGDFFPTILQDNHRATLLGTRTAGAGGYVLDFSYPNQYGIAGYRLTGSIAARVDQNPVENLGVKPDLEYEISAHDLQSNYSDYIQKIKSTMSDLIVAAPKN